MSGNTERLNTALAGRYQIEKQLGQGGMATVYLAKDLKHDRMVAVKVLKPELAAVLGAERFVVEIKTTAALQHPHILPLFDSGTADGFLYYVMPYIEGETLRGKLNRETQFSVDEAVRITAQVADALDYAHRHGVIHRDIKPENILLHDGRPMVADFGIALAVSAAAGGRMTETGLSLGTPHYMSPEQATAEIEITGRSDIYSLASVMYEMLAGQPPHLGGSAQQIIMRIVTDTARPVTELRKSVSPHVAAALAKALEKLPADRFSTAKEFAEALGNQSFTAALGTSAGPAVARLSWQGRAMLAGALALGAIVASIAFLLMRERPERAVVRFPLTLPAGRRFDMLFRDDAPFAISPDGKRVVYSAIDSVSGGRRLFVRSLDQMEGTAIQGTEDAVAPFFSPNGQWIGFFSGDDEALRKVPAAGGPPTTLARNVLLEFASGSWSEDGFIYFSSRAGTMNRVRETGGPPEEFKRDSVQWFGWPTALPGGRGVLGQMCLDYVCSRWSFGVMEVDANASKALVDGAMRGWYIGDGVLVYVTPDGTAYAVPFDLKRREVRGTPVPVQDQINVAADGPWITISSSGSMMYQPGSSQSSAVQLVEVDRSGRETVLLAAAGRYEHPRWSPGRDRVALTVTKEASRQIDVYDVRSKTLSQLTSDGINYRPSWSPDGRRIAFVSVRADSTALYWQSADGSAPSEHITTKAGTAGNSSWTRDGRWVVFDGQFTSSQQSEDVFAVSTGADRGVQSVTASPGNEQTGSVSPDGRWVVYNSDEGGGRYQVYVRPFFKAGGRFLVSTGPAVGPLWSSNNEVVYEDMTTSQLVAARLEFGSTVRVVQRTPLFSTAPYVSSTPSFLNMDVSWDGQRFLALRYPGASREKSPPIVVLNWFDEVKRKVAEGQGGKK